MNINLRPDLQERVNERIQNGEYENADALIQHALDLFLGMGFKDVFEFWDRAGAHNSADTYTSTGQRTTIALKIGSRIASMADQEVRQRYHELVDKGLVCELSMLERVELERIKARLDAEDRDPQIEARDRQWETERSELLQSIEDLLRKL